jgi:hypothetical protein
MGFAVRNLKNIGSFPIHVFVPPQFSPVYKIIIDNGTDQIDVTEALIEGSYTDGITETIGNFSIILDNSHQQYTGIIGLYNKVYMYLDYGDTASTLVFTGLIERPSNTNQQMILTGRSSAVRTIGKLVTYAATNVTRSSILKDIVSKYFTGIITVNNVQDDTGLATVSYEDKPFWEIVQELCSAGEFDAYVDATFDLHYFPSGSITNETEAVVFDINLIETGDFSPDMQSITNRVKVYGSSNGDVQIIATANDVNSQTSYDIKEVVIEDSSIASEQEAQDKANFELQKDLVPPIVGTITCLMLPSLNPGERVRISDPLNNLLPSQEGYTIQKFTHKFSNDDPPKTELTVQKERDSIPQILKKRIRFEYTSNTASNPNEMEYSKVFEFNTASGITTNCDITSGALRPTSTIGTWISEQFTLTAPSTTFESRIVGSGLDAVSVFVSVDGGSTYNFLNPTIATTLTTGTTAILKVTFESDGWEIDALGLYYK